MQKVHFRLTYVAPKGRCLNSILIAWDQAPQWGEKAKKKSARIFRVDAEDCRRSRSQTPDTNVPIYSSKQSLRRGDVSLLRETDWSLVQIIWKPDERDYIREGLRDSKKKTCWPAPVSLLPIHNLSILIISPFFTINVRALMVACLFNCFKK